MPLKTVLARFLRQIKTVRNGLTLTTTASTTLVPAGSGNVYRDITWLQASNSSATATTITFSDGVYSYVWELAASGGGFNINFDPPLAASAPGTSWTVALGTGVSSVTVGVQAVETY